VQPQQPPEEKPKAQSTEWQTPAKKPSSLPYRHDGFFLRVALGGAYNSASASLDIFDDALGTTGERRFNVTGGGLTLQLAIGGTLPNGLVIGGLVHTASAGNPTYEFEDGPELEGGSLTQA
jgi:hypothetical protein